MTASQCKTPRTISWILQVVMAGAFVVMGAIPKLTGNVYSVALFEQLGFEPGRLIVGGAEALAAVLLLVPGAHAIGGVLVMGAAGLATLLCAAIARAKIGGQTGDILGATQQLSEIAALLALAVVI